MPHLTVLTSALKSHLQIEHGIVTTQTYAAVSWKLKHIEAGLKKYSIAKAADVIGKCEAAQFNYIEERATFVDKMVTHPRITCDEVCPFCVKAAPHSDVIHASYSPELPVKPDIVDILGAVNILRPEELTTFSVRSKLSIDILEEHALTASEPRCFIFTYERIRYIGKLGNTDALSMATVGSVKLNPNSPTIVQHNGDIRRINTPHSVDTSATFIPLDLPEGSILLISVDETAEEEEIEEPTDDVSADSNDESDVEVKAATVFKGKGAQKSDSSFIKPSFSRVSFSVPIVEDDERRSEFSEIDHFDDGLFDDLRKSLCWSKNMDEAGWTERIKAIAMLAKAGVLSGSEARRILL